MSVPATEDQIREAVRVLYHDPDPQRKKVADSALKGFQRSKESWQIAHSLLASTSSASNTDVIFFAAATLFAKVSHDYDELDAAQRIPFRDAVIQHLKTHINGSTIVLTQLSRAVASLAAQMIEWENPASDLIHLLGDAQPERTMALLHILQCLPEESFSKRRLIPEQRLQCVCYTPCVQVMILLQKILHRAEDPSMQRHTMKAVHSWMRYACDRIDETTLLQSTLLLQDCFRALLSPDTELVIAAGLVIEAAFQVVEGRALLAFGDALVATTLQVWPRFEQAQADDDFEVSLALMQLFVQMGESCIFLVERCVPRAQQIIQLIGQCTANEDPELVSRALGFWFRLGDSFAGLRRTDPPQALSMSSYYADDLYKVVDVLRVAMRFPSEYETQSSDSMDERKRFRYAVADAVLDVSSLLDTSILLQRALASTRIAIAEYAQDSTKWNVLEACLYSIRSLARSVNPSELNGASSSVLPDIMSELLRLPLHPMIRYTATLIIGRYSDWVALNPQYLEPLLHYVIAGLQDTTVRSSAAMSFQYLCSGCSQHLAANALTTVMGVYSRIGELVIEDQREIIEGVCAVITACPPEQTPRLIANVIEPVVIALNQSSMNAQTDTTQATQQAGINLDRLAHIFKSLHIDASVHSAYDPSCPSHPLNTAVQSIWPLLARVADQFQGDEQLMEKLCRLLKTSLRACGSKFPMLMPMTELLIKLYDKRQHSCYLYTISVALDVFARDVSLQQQIPLFTHLLDSFGKCTFRVLRDQNAVRDHPDVAEDYFHLLKRYVEILPSVVFASPLLPPSFLCALCGVRVRHREASDAVFSFLRATVDKGTQQASVREIVDNVLRQHGQALFDELMLALQDDLSRSQIRNLIELMSSLLTFSRPLCAELLPNALTKLPASVPRKNEIGNRLLHSSSVHDQREALLDLEGVVRNDARRG